MTPSSRTKKIPVTCDPHGHLERRPLADLTPFQGGFKDLDDSRYAKLKASILAEGFMAPVFVWRDKILDGHQRTTVLEREGWDVEGDVPVVEIEADDEAGAARKLLKLTSAYGKPQLEGVFDFMQTHDLDLGDFADVDLPDFDEGELEVLFGEDDAGEEPIDEAPEPPVTPVTRSGDLWCMGKHRVLCGDSTLPADIDRLCDGAMVDMVATDPPYAIYGSATGVGSDITDDKMVRPFFEAFFRTVSGKLRLFGHVYVCCDWRSWAAIWEASKRTDIRPRNLLIWDKGGGGLGSNYANTYEGIGFFAKNPPQKTMVSDGKKGHRMVHKPNMLRFSRPSGDDRHHNAAKPIGMIEQLIENSSNVGDVVLEPFSGSGTTILASERQGRACLAMEIEPACGDLAVTRWQEYTNEEAILDGDGRTFSEVKAERLSGEDVAQAQAAG